MRRAPPACPLSPSCICWPRCMLPLPGVLRRAWGFPRARWVECAAGPHCGCPMHPARWVSAPSTPLAHAHDMPLLCLLFTRGGGGGSRRSGRTHHHQLGQRALGRNHRRQRRHAPGGVALAPPALPDCVRLQPLAVCACCCNPLAAMAPQPALALQSKSIPPGFASIVAGDVFSTITLEAVAQPLLEGLVPVAIDVGGLLGGHSGEHFLSYLQSRAGRAFR